MPVLPCIYYQCESVCLYIVVTERITGDEVRCVSMGSNFSQGPIVFNYRVYKTRAQCDRHGLVVSACAWRIRGYKFDFPPG